MQIQPIEAVSRLQDPTVPALFCGIDLQYSPGGGSSPDRKGDKDGAAGAARKHICRLLAPGTTQAQAQAPVELRAQGGRRHIFIESRANELVNRDNEFAVIQKFFEIGEFLPVFG
jgi:hypothetical protein